MTRMSGFEIFNQVVDARREEVRTYEAWAAAKADTESTDDEIHELAGAYRDAAIARSLLVEAIRTSTVIDPAVADLAIRAAQTIS